ncbi:hypothetical protein D9M68_688390 [compost metagenome]
MLIRTSSLVSWKNDFDINQDRKQSGLIALVFPAPLAPTTAITLLIRSGNTADGQLRSLGEARPSMRNEISVSSANEKKFSNLRLWIIFFVLLGDFLQNFVEYGLVRTFFGHLSRWPG